MNWQFIHWPASPHWPREDEYDFYEEDPMPSVSKTVTLTEQEKNNREYAPTPRAYVSFSNYGLTRTGNLTIDSGNGRYGVSAVMTRDEVRDLADALEKFLDRKVVEKKATPILKAEYKDGAIIIENFRVEVNDPAPF